MKTMLHKAKTADTSNPQWLRTDNLSSVHYSADDLIDAYQSGCDEGFSKYMNTIRETISSNLHEAQATAESFFNDLNKENNICKSILLRMTSIDKFDLLFAIDKEVYFDDEQSRPIYEDSFARRKKNPLVNISFMPYANSINKNSLAADNYLVFYGEL